MKFVSSMTLVCIGMIFAEVDKEEKGKPANSDTRKNGHNS